MLLKYEILDAKFSIPRMFHDKMIIMKRHDDFREHLVCRLDAAVDVCRFDERICVIKIHNGLYFVITEILPSCEHKLRVI